MWPSLFSINACSLDDIDFTRFVQLLECIANSIFLEI